MKITTKTLFVFLIILFSVSSVTAIPGSWYGYVTYDGSIADNGTVVDVYVNDGSSASVSTTVGAVQGNGYYLAHVEANNNDNITFKIYGNTVFETAQNWSAGFHHPNFNLTANSTPNGQTAPDYTGLSTGNIVTNLGCSGGYEVLGICRSHAYYCDGDGSCESSQGETTSTCSADCSSGSSSGGGGGGGGGGSLSLVSSTSNQTTQEVADELSENLDIQSNAVSLSKSVISTSIKSSLDFIKNEETLSSSAKNSLNDLNNLVSANVQKTTTKLTYTYSDGTQQIAQKVEYTFTASEDTEQASFVLMIPPENSGKVVVDSSINPIVLDTNPQTFVWHKFGMSSGDKLSVKVYLEDSTVTSKQSMLTGNFDMDGIGLIDLIRQYYDYGSLDLKDLLNAVRMFYEG